MTFAMMMWEIRLIHEICLEEIKGLIMETNEIIALSISIMSLVISFFTFIVNLILEKRKDYQNRVNLTVSTFEKLQTEVFDCLNKCNENDISDVVKYYKTDNIYKDMYNDYRSQIAKCEHFAVGVNSNVYDYDIVDKLAGKYIVLLYRKVEPIIIEARCNSNDENIYVEFENLYKKLKETNII